MGIRKQKDISTPELEQAPPPRVLFQVVKVTNFDDDFPREEINQGVEYIGNAAREQLQRARASTALSKSLDRHIRRSSGPRREALEAQKKALQDTQTRRRAFMKKTLAGLEELLERIDGMNQLMRSALPPRTRPTIDHGSDGDHDEQQQLQQLNE